MSIWITKNITLDLPKETTIDELIDALYDIKKEYGNLKLPSRNTIILSNYTSDEINNHYKDKENGI